jgi:hypothetical protein
VQGFGGGGGAGGDDFVLLLLCVCVCECLSVCECVRLLFLVLSFIKIFTYRFTHTHLQGAFRDRLRSILNGRSNLVLLVESLCVGGDDGGGRQDLFREARGRVELLEAAL